MKKIIAVVLALMLLGLTNINAQVRWNFRAEKKSDKVYEIHMTASVDKPWHIYSQHTPAGGPIPSTVAINKHPMITTVGVAAEAGNLVKKREEVFGIDVMYFENQVDFVQVVSLKAKVKTKVSGTVKYMVCNDRECLPPKTVPFTVDLK